MKSQFGFVDVSIRCKRAKFTYRIPVVGQELTDQLAEFLSERHRPLPKATRDELHRCLSKIGDILLVGSGAI